MKEVMIVTFPKSPKRSKLASASSILERLKPPLEILKHRVKRKLRNLCQRLVVYIRHKFFKCLQDTVGFDSDGHFLNGKNKNMARSCDGGRSSKVGSSPSSWGRCKNCESSVEYAL